MPDKPDCVVLITHGVGNQEPRAILEEFQEGLLTFLNARLRKQAAVTARPAPATGSLERGYDILLESLALPDGPPARVRLREFHWADLDGNLNPNTASLLSFLGWMGKALLRLKPGNLVPPEATPTQGALLWLRAAGLFFTLLVASMLGLGLAAINDLFRGRYNFLARWVGLIMEYLGDIRQMEQKEVRRAINQRLNRTLAEVLAFDQPRCLVLVSHSLGNVFVCDQLRRQLKPAPVPTGWISLGSPLWVLPMLDNAYELPHKLDLDLVLGWHNQYDPNDPLGGPVYNRVLANFDDQWYRQHFNPVLAHTDYLRARPHMDRLWEVVSNGLQFLETQPQPAARVEVRAPLNRRPLVLGPFLRHSPPGELRVWTAHLQPGPHQATLFKNGEYLTHLEEEVLAKDQLTHLWRFTGLQPGADYELELAWWDQEARQWWRLAQRNRQGQALSETPTRWPLATPKSPDQGPWRFLFASCHHPRHVEWDGLSGNAFIRDILRRLAQEPGRRPDGLFFIGDQIYADDWWEEHLFLPWRDPEQRFLGRLATYADCYDFFWRPWPWADLLRQAPSYMMWDDHDIRDGWGNNVHDFRGDDFSAPAKEKFAAAAQAFRLYQACGNPPASSKDDFQFSFDWGPISFFVFDPRTYRQFRKPVPFHPYGPDQMARYHKWLAEAGERAQVLVVITSTPTAFIKGWRLNLGAFHMEKFMRWGERYPHVEAFDDDWRDQLPCRLNVAARDVIVGSLAGVLAAHPAGSKRGILMAGDVHCGQYARIDIDRQRAIDLWTASPISNIPNWPMRLAAAWAWPGRPVGDLQGRQLVARQMQTKAARNIVELTIDPNAEPGMAPRVRGELVYESGFSLRTISHTLG